MVNILTWNIRHGGGKRMKKIIESLNKHKDADILVLTEFRNNKNKDALLNYCNLNGYKHTYFANVLPIKNTVLIASKEAYSFELFNNIGRYNHRVLKIFNEKVNIYGCYFPNQNNKKEVFDFLINELKKNRNVIIAGDINTGKHFIDEEKDTLLHAEYLHKFEENYLIDAFRFLHKDKREYSWYSTVLKNGFRLDHFFIDTNFKFLIKKCEYIHSYREEKISDHSMMVLELKD